MEQKQSEGGLHSVQGPLMGVFLILLIVFGIWLFLQPQWWMPAVASEHGTDIDRVYFITLVISGVLFIILQGILAFLSVRYGDRPKARAAYWIKPGLEKRFALVAGILIFGVDMTLFSIGESNWYKKWSPAPAGSRVVEVLAEQFMWNFRYPGADGVFGKTELSLTSGTNPFGLDLSDPAAKDDVVSINQLHLVDGEPVRLRLRSRDVVHSFNLPAQRMRQDVVPGMMIEFWLVPNKSGQFEIVCSQICGLAHYRMRAMLTVEDQAAFDKWLDQVLKEGS